MTGSSAALVALLLAAGPARAGVPQHAAVVVGIETYDRLPADARLRGAREDAARVAEALETRAGFQHVQLLTDASATRAAIESLLRGGLGLGPDDLLLFYFVGHGIGGDFGEPRLLTCDSEAEVLEQSSWPVAELAAALREGSGAGRILVVTDASHAGAVQGLALLGPSPDQWPAFDRPAMVLSSTGSREVALPGAMAEAFSTAVAGRADASADGVVSSGELYRFLVGALPGATDDAQHPTVNARHDPTFAVASPGVQAHADGRDAAAIDKVKFVFRGGISPTVECRGQPVATCDPSCYVWDLQPGTCVASAVLGDRRETFAVQVQQRGGWLCEEARGRLDCRPGP